MYPFNVTSLPSKRRIVASGPLRNDEAQPADNGGGVDKGVDKGGLKTRAIGQSWATGLSSPLDCSFCRPGWLLLPKLTCNAALERSSSGYHPRSRSPWTKPGDPFFNCQLVIVIKEIRFQKIEDLRGQVDWKLRLVADLRNKLVIVDWWSMKNRGKGGREREKFVMFLSCGSKRKRDDSREILDERIYSFVDMLVQKNSSKKKKKKEHSFVHFTTNN